MKYAFIRARDSEFRICRMCEVLRVSRSGYYDWQVRPESKRSQQDHVLLAEIRKVHERTKQAYGAVKTWRALRSAGVKCGKHRVARLRRLEGIEARRKRKFRWPMRHGKVRRRHPISCGHPLELVGLIGSG